MSRIYVLKTVQKIPAELDVVWKFFSRPGNLQAITPSSMQFVITSPFLSEEAYAGEIIIYKVRPVLNIPVRWVTEITQVKQQEYFTDEQRFGPYAMWHHEHHFKKIEGGVEMTDIVTYKIPFGFIGDIANTLFVKNKLREIFTYRFQKIESHFGRWKDGELKEISFY